MKEANSVFGALEEPDVEALMRIGTQQQLHVSDQLLTEGTYHDAIYLVLDGELSVSVKGRNGAIAYVGKGEIVLRNVAARSAAGIGHTVRDHPGDGGAHPSRRAPGEPRR